MTLGKEVIDKRDEHFEDETDADFYQMFEFNTSLPGDSQLKIDVLDHDALAFYQSFDFFLPLTDNPMKLFVPMASLETL